MNSVKKIIAIVVAFALLVGILAFSVIYRNKKNNEQHQSLQELSMQSDTDETIGTDNDGKPVVVTDDGEYEIYFDGDTVTIVYGDYKIDVETWKDSFNAELPTAVSKNVDSDSDNELLLRVRTGVSNNDDGTSTVMYAIYLFDPYTDENGEKTFTKVIANTNTWAVPFEQTVRAEVTQLESCKKILQYTMESVENEIKYDKNGLATGDYVGYAKALTDGKGNYYSFKDWKLGQGIYYLDKEGNISLDIQVVVDYADVDKSQIIGFVNCQIQYKDNAFSIVPKKLYFKAQDEYKVTDPRDAAETKWTSTIKNQGANPNFQNKTIDWIDWEYNVSSLGSSQSVNFGNYSSKIKCVSTVEFTQSSITLTAKEGYKFSSNVADKGNFSVTINNGDDEQIDISYTCSVKTVDSKSTLVITLDRNYSKSELKNMVLKYGV